MSDRTFKIEQPHMTGRDIEQWQQFLYDAFRARWGIAAPIVVDGDYGVATRGYTASFMRAWGVDDTGEAMESGVTDDWRIKLRNNNRSDEEEKRAHSAEIRDYRDRLRRRYDKLEVGGVSTPCNTISVDSWGWVPGVHDGIDINTAGRPAPLLAVVRSKVVRVSDDWWGAANPGGAVGDLGDGIIILESLVKVGPYEKGMHICYGHAEHPKVREGDTVDAGDPIGLSGKAVTYHTHWMINMMKPVKGFYTGRGDRNPRPHYDYARAND